eukprot:c55726_g1_i1 orf=2-187(-)
MKGSGNTSEKTKYHCNHQKNFIIRLAQITFTEQSLVHKEDAKHQPHSFTSTKLTPEASHQT